MVHQQRKHLPIGSTLAIGNGVYGQSITDPCLGWDKSAALLYRMADYV